MYLRFDVTPSPLHTVPYVFYVIYNTEKLIQIDK